MPDYEGLRSRREFIDLRKRGRFLVIRGLFCVEFVRVTGYEVNQFGFTASRKVGGAVVRNRAKRRLKEVVRKFAPQMKSGLACNFIATRATPHVKWTKIEKAMLFFLAKNNLIHSSRQSFNVRGSCNHATRR